MKRSARLVRHTRLRSSGRIAPPPRKPSEYARIYGSRARVLWVKSLPCCACGAFGSVNAHSEVGGTGYKADAKTIAPLCDKCHRAYDEHRAPFDTALARGAVKLHAAVTDARWTRMGEVAS